MSTHDIEAFHARLQEWYATHGRRDLPWRTTRDPYAIYVSEVMLQQTQVKTVLERYYFPFLQAFPTLEALAKAERQDVLKRWEGLGYYNRAVNLHKAAQATAPAYQLPEDFDALIALPGIGRNTAHAVLAFAFHQAVPVMEANVKRVLHRVFAEDAMSDTALWEKANLLLNKDAPFDYNQAMMDIGATVCTKTKPLCALCPAQGICAGKEAPERYPAPKQKKATPVRKRTIIAVMDESERFYLTARTSRFLTGLYGFIEQDQAETNCTFLGHAAAIADMQHLGHITQTYSHFQLQAEAYIWRLPLKSNDAHWYDLKSIGALPLSRADEKLYKLLIKNKQLRLNN
mgnify:CR=1 FL=1